jgi:hypothetical protein
LTIFALSTNGKPVGRRSQTKEAALNYQFIVANQIGLEWPMRRWAQPTLPTGCIVWRPPFDLPFKHEGSDLDLLSMAWRPDSRQFGEGVAQVGILEFETLFRQSLWHDVSTIQG